VAPMSMARDSPGVIELDGKLYVVGSSSLRNPLCLMECFDPDTNSWTSKASLIEKVHYFGVNSMKKANEIQI